jgi:uncharacterized membrane protein YfcA
MEWVLCGAIGIFSGFASGLLGIGGGVVIVPALLYGFPFLGVGGPDVAQVAIATSLAVILPTSVSSVRAHWKRGAVDWLAFRRVAPGVAAGSLIGVAVAKALSGGVLTAIFIAFAIYAAYRMLKAPANAAAAALPLPSTGQLSTRGVGIGALSAMVGVGGGLLSVPLLSTYIGPRSAVGTAAALGIPLAVAGVVGYLIAGQPTQTCAAHCVGYVYFPAALVVSLTAVFTAPLGARLAHAVPIATLKRIFALVIVGVVANIGVRAAEQSAPPPSPVVAQAATPPKPTPAPHKPHPKKKKHAEPPRAPTQTPPVVEPIVALKQ